MLHHEKKHSLTLRDGQQRGAAVSPRSDGLCGHRDAFRVIANMAYGHEERYAHSLYRRAWDALSGLRHVARWQRYGVAGWRCSGESRCKFRLLIISLRCKNENKDNFWSNKDNFWSKYKMCVQQIGQSNVDWPSS